MVDREEILKLRKKEEDKKQSGRRERGRADESSLTRGTLIGKKRGTWKDILLQKVHQNQSSSLFFPYNELVYSTNAQQ